MADAQAILWFNEKDLFTVYNAVNKSGEKTDYESAAQEVLKKHGIPHTVSSEFLRDDGGAVPPGGKSGETQQGLTREKGNRKPSFSVAQEGSPTQGDASGIDIPLKLDAELMGKVSDLQRQLRIFLRVDCFIPSRGAETEGKFLHLGGGKFNGIRRFIALRLLFEIPSDGSEYPAPSIDDEDSASEPWRVGDRDSGVAEFTDRFQAPISHIPYATSFRQSRGSR